jgi:hypothetical protein
VKETARKKIIEIDKAQMEQQQLQEADTLDTIDTTENNR